MIGERVPRKEDRRLLTGRGLFGNDAQRPGMLHARIVRSPVARSSDLAVDASVASTAPGVVDIVTAADLNPCPRIPVRLAVQGIDLTAHLQPVLGGPVVRYVGEPVAVVLATDPYLAEDAAELVEVTATPEPAVLDATASPEVAADFALGYGDVDAAFSAADQVVELDFAVGRHSAVPLEPRALVADIDPAARHLEIYGGTKVPVFNQGVLAAMLGWDPTAIRLHAGDAGGGFGVRGEFYPEDFLVPWLAVRHRAAVSWVEDRAEHLMAVNHSRQQHHRIAVALTSDGRILGLRDEVVHDNGAYARTHGIIVPELTLAMLPGPYRIAAYRGRVRAVLTSKTPCGTYRAPGRFEGTAVREQLLDLAADRLGMDRLELRRRNLLRPDELPHQRAMSTLGTDVVLDAGDYLGLLDKAVARVAELGWWQEVSAARAAGRIAGIGTAMFLEKSGLGPTETADVEVTRTGRVLVHSGGASLGQGIETALAQIAGEVLRVGADRVDVVNGDTLLQPYGTGSWASRSTVVSGSAVRGAALRVLARMIELAGRMLEVSADDLEFSGGEFRVAGVPQRSLTYAEIAAAALPGSPHLGADEPAGLAARQRFSVDHMTYPYGVHVAMVELDAGSGAVRVPHYLVAYEVGRAVNPALVEDQLRGGVAQGIGGALFEEFRYDGDGQPLSTTFMDYLMPTAAEIPVVDVLLCQDSPATTNPLGVRGAGEGGLTAAGGAVVNAVRDAVSAAAGRPVVVDAIPLTPERVLALLDASGVLHPVRPLRSERSPV